MDSKVSRGFGWLNATQFLGALNDNILKLLIIFYLIEAKGTGNAGTVAALAGLAFVLPFLLFSAPAGCLADRFAKSGMIVAVKVVEVAVTGLAMAAFALGMENGLYLVVFLMATHSALFAPAKYGVIPELVPTERLSAANGLIESFTFLAIIIGTALASVLAQLTTGHAWLAGAVCFCIALCGLGTSWKIGRTGASDKARHIALFPAEILRTVKSIRGDSDLMLAMIGLAWFMFVGAFAQLNLIGYGIQRLGLTEAQSGYLFLARGLRHRSRFAAGGQTFRPGRGIRHRAHRRCWALRSLRILLHVGPASLSFSIAVIVLFGVSAGLFSLPLQTFIQFRAEPARRGEVLAASSFINWIGIFLASGLTWIFSRPLGLSAAQGFSIIGAMTLVLTAADLLDAAGLPAPLHRARRHADLLSHPHHRRAKTCRWKGRRFSFPITSPGWTPCC